MAQKCYRNIYIYIPWTTKPVIRVHFLNNYLKIWNLQKNLNTEKIIFKVVQMEFLAMHITIKNVSLDRFTVVIVQNIFMEHDLS